MFDALIRTFSKLPGLGPRSARRIMLHLIKRKDDLMKPLIQDLTHALQNIKICSACGNIDAIDPCTLCTDQHRDRAVMCVVADVIDIWAIERSGSYKGMFHVLGGVLSAVNGVGPEQLNIAGLIKRLDVTREIIIALSPTVEGQTTIAYLIDQIQHLNIKMTTLAQGIPLGGELDYIDDGTITMAFSHRSIVEEIA